jgi:hypothetical protein
VTEEAGGEGAGAGTSVAPGARLELGTGVSPVVGALLQETIKKITPRAHIKRKIYLFFITMLLNNAYGCFQNAFIIIL